MIDDILKYILLLSKISKHWGTRTGYIYKDHRSCQRYSHTVSENLITPSPAIGLETTMDTSSNFSKPFIGHTIESQESVISSGNSCYNSGAFSILGSLASMASYGNAAQHHPSSMSRMHIRSCIAKMRLQTFQAGELSAGSSRYSL
jgi:hypothetical protein